MKGYQNGIGVSSTASPGTCLQQRRAQFHVSLSLDQFTDILSCINNGPVKMSSMHLTYALQYMYQGGDMAKVNRSLYLTSDEEYDVLTSIIDSHPLPAIDAKDWTQIEATKCAIEYTGSCGQLDWYYYTSNHGHIIFVLVIVDGLGRLRYREFFLIQGNESDCLVRNFKVFRIH